jgi:hypothetical protein
MGRGAQADTRRAADQQLALQNALNQRLYSQSQALEGTVAAGYRDLLANPGYTGAQKAAMTNQSMGSLASAFAALASRSANRAARTRNAAGYNDLLGELAREQRRQAGSWAQANEFAFADRSRLDQLAALEGLGGIYGINSTLLGRAMGIPADLLGVRAGASRGGVGVGSILGQGLGFLGRILG